MYKEDELNCKSCSKEDSTKVNIKRFIEKLDSYFSKNDLNGALSCINFWENDAMNLNDERGLLSILNEKIGISRRLNNEQMALESIDKAKEILIDGNYDDSISVATIYINMATTLNCFKHTLDGIPLYEKAEEIYKKYEHTTCFEYASLLNNKATALANLYRYDEAEELINEAIDILKKDGNHDGEIAVSLINLAHLLYDRDDNAIPKVEETLDLAWDYINSDNLKHDGNYAYILTKCAPSFKYFNRTLEAEALEEVAKEIYGEK